MAFAGRMVAAAVAMAGAAMSFAGFGPGIGAGLRRSPRAEGRTVKARNKPKPRALWSPPTRHNKHGRPNWGRKLNGVM